MKNKTVIILLSVLAVMFGTVAVINFCLGNVLGGIGDALMASSDALMAYAVYRVGLMSNGLKAVYEAVIGLLEQEMPKRFEQGELVSGKTLTDIIKTLVGKEDSE